MVKLLYILDLVSVQHDTLSGAGQARVQQHSGLLLRGHHRHRVGPHQGIYISAILSTQYYQHNLHCLHCLCVQKAEAGVLQRLEGHLGYVTSLLWVGGGGLLVSASWDHTVKVRARVVKIPSPIPWCRCGTRGGASSCTVWTATASLLPGTVLCCTVLYYTIPSPGSRSPPTLATSSPAARTGRSTSGT